MEWNISLIICKKVSTLSNSLKNFHFWLQGQVITFLDAHCECTEGWLEPLLARIVLDRRTVVCPIIDVISDETFEYVTASDQTWGGFNWKLNFRWYRVPTREMQRRNNDRTEPLRTPTMVNYAMIRDALEKIT